MKFFLDNCIAPVFAKVLNVLAERQGYPIPHLRDRLSLDTKDPEWIRVLAEEGEWIIVSGRLSADYGGGYSVQTLRYFRQFYVEFPNLLPIRHAVRGELASTLSPLDIGNVPRDNSWQPGQLNPNLSWTHYRTLLRVSRSEARAFYEIEAIKNNWSS